MEFLLPALFAIMAILFMPDRNRKEIMVLTLTGVLALLLFQALLLLGLHVRIDLGRAVLMYVSVGALSAFLATDTKKVSVDAFKRGSDFLAAGRLEPAFAEFRRCNPSETVAAVMYKLSLAFEQQAKPERAEAVLEWMKRTHGGAESSDGGEKKAKNGAPQRLGRYVVEKRIGRGAMGAVYLAKDPRINRAVAVKAIPIEKEFEDEELKEARQRFYSRSRIGGPSHAPEHYYCLRRGRGQRTCLHRDGVRAGHTATPVHGPEETARAETGARTCGRDRRGTRLRT